MTDIKSLRLILHGKSADAPELRDAVTGLRELGHDLSVRVTWEAGDAHRFTQQAQHDGIDVIVSGGGDGLLNEVVNGVMQGHAPEQATLAVLPMGTANDFATSCGIPEDLSSALNIAAHGSVQTIDLATANDRFFINVASGGFGAQVTTTTPKILKKVLGGAAYTLMGFAGAVRGPDTNRLRIESESASYDEHLVMVAVANGRRSGGGFEVAPEARIDDGLLDATFVRDFPVSEAAVLAQELKNPGASENRFVFTLRSSWVTLTAADGVMDFVNLDGEPSPAAHKMEFQIRPRALRMVLPESASPLLSRKLQTVSEEQNQKSDTLSSKE